MRGPNVWSGKYVIKANTPVEHPEVYPDVLNTVKENASDKMSDHRQRPRISRTFFHKIEANNRGCSLSKYICIWSSQKT